MNKDLYQVNKLDANAKSASLPEKMESIYQKDIDMDKFKIQLKMLPDAVKVTPANAWYSPKAGYMYTNFV